MAREDEISGLGSQTAVDQKQFNAWVQMRDVSRDAVHQLGEEIEDFIQKEKNAKTSLYAKHLLSSLESEICEMNELSMKIKSVFAEMNR